MALNSTLFARLNLGTFMKPVCVSVMCGTHNAAVIAIARIVFTLSIIVITVAALFDQYKGSLQISSGLIPILALLFSHNCWSKQPYATRREFANIEQFFSLFHFKISLLQDKRILASQ